MNPFVVAGEVAGLSADRRPPRASVSANGREHGLAGDADIRGLVPGDEALEIGGRGLQERLVMVRDQSGAGGKAAPIANSGGDAVAAA